jgi:glycine reductase
VFQNKKVVVLGERDGIAAGAMAACVEAAGEADIVFSATECFV